MDEDILIDIESPYEQSRDQNDWKQEFHNNVLFSSDERICDQITMKLQNCKSDGQTDNNQYFFVPCEPNVVRVEKLKVIYKGSSKGKQ